MNKGNTQNALQTAGAQTAATETADERVTRLYAHQGGPLIGWLWDEARRRGLELQQMAAELGVTYGYISQLRTGIRRTSTISHEFATACGRFLGVPTVVVFLLAGFLTMRDFSVRALSEEDIVETAVRKMLEDPHARSALPTDVLALPLEAKRALAMLYSESTGRDLGGWSEMPHMVRWLQRAAVVHDESEASVDRGHRDVLDRGEEQVVS